MRSASVDTRARGWCRTPWTRWSLSARTSRRTSHRGSRSSAPKPRCVAPPVTGHPSWPNGTEPGCWWGPFHDPKLFCAGPEDGQCFCVTLPWQGFTNYTFRENVVMIVVKNVVICDFYHFSDSLWMSKQQFHFFFFQIKNNHVIKRSILITLFTSQ